jgi:PhnB protein
MASSLHLHPYLFFGGSCREAMQFYKSIFGGELMLSTFGEGPADAHSNPAADSDAMRDKIMHASLNGPVKILACDNPGLIHARSDGQFALSLEGTDETLLTDYFHKLSDGGRVLARLGKQFWGDTFGMVEDQYGVQWMISIKAPA